MADIEHKVAVGGREHAAIIHEAGEGGYWAEIPALPGCFTVADTLDELRGNLIEAAQCWLLTSADMENYRRNDRRRIVRRRPAATLA